MNRPDWQPAAVYTAVALLVLGPLLLPGYILMLDMVFTPHVPWPTVLSNLTPYNALMSIMSYLIPGWVLQKMVLILILVGAGLGMHRLVQVPNPWARYLAGVFYLINPFTYDRFMSGQYLVLAGYALMPWFVAALTRLIRRPERGNALRLAGWLLAISCVSLHTLGFAFTALVVGLVIGVWRYRRRVRQSRRLALWLGAALVILAVACSYWLLPLVSGRSQQAGLIQGFDQAQLLSFATVPDPTLGLPLNVLALHGFWVGGQDLYLSPKAVNPWWWAVALLVLVLAGIGARPAWRHDRTKLVLISILGLTGFALALGVMDSPLAPINQWLFDNVPLMRGYREPGKFIGLVALAEAYLVGWGIDWLLERLSRARRAALAQYVPGLLLVLPLLGTPTMVWAAGGQLHTSRYPADWYALDQHLRAESDQRGRMLFLPWHQYMTFQFSGRLMANPASRFFSRSVIQGDNAEIGLIERQDYNAQSAEVEDQILTPGAAGYDIGPALAKLGVEYVVLAKAADYADYSWISRQPGLTLESDTQTLEVYRNLKYVSEARP
ncbi:MAG TPA: hypothetical protein VHQ86_05030 [Candidatus Saccharimonadia bacterium]|jgi:uncharacterized membrane protein YoaK (UPF0700 family)|nr:hypothetical protein [Candidatus Saccharimonadia bacterium]